MMFSRNGYRFGVVGEGGVVALWRSDMLDSVSVLRELWACGAGHAVVMACVVAVLVIAHAASRNSPAAVVSVVRRAATTMHRLGCLMVRAYLLLLWWHAAAECSQTGFTAMADAKHPQRGADVHLPQTWNTCYSCTPAAADSCARLCFTPLQEVLGGAEWVHHCTYRGGSDLAFLGDTGSQLVVAGQGDRGGCIISLWDTLLPPESVCVHEVGVVT
jgi:hypothetical protein